MDINQRSNMTRLKANKETEYQLSEQELEYVTAVNELANRHARENTQAIGAFLKFVCVNRLGYDTGENLQFEIDFNSDDKKLKVIVLPHLSN